jgi:hypothetical protein
VKRFSWERPYYIYTTPTMPEDVKIAYWVVIDNRFPEPRDQAGNRWKIRNARFQRVSWRFRISPEGDILQPEGELAPGYAEEFP